MAKTHHKINPFILLKEKNIGDSRPKKSSKFYISTCKKIMAMFNLRVRKIDGYFLDIAIILTIFTPQGCFNCNKA